MILQAVGALELRGYNPDNLHRLEWLLDTCYPDESWTRRDLHKFVVRRDVQNVLRTLHDGKDDLYGAILYTVEADQCRIRRIAVHPDWRRQGIASYLLGAIVGPRSVVRKSYYVARVRESNLAGQLLLHNKFHFSFDPKARREKAPTGEDFYVFTLRKPEAWCRKRPLKS